MRGTLRSADELADLLREARELRERPDAVPACALEQGSVPGRSGTMAVQGGEV